MGQAPWLSKFNEELEYNVVEFVASYKSLTTKAPKVLKEGFASCRKGILTKWKVTPGLLLGQNREWAPDYRTSSDYVTSASHDELRIVKSIES